MQKPRKGVPLYIAFVLLSTPLFWLMMKVAATFLGNSLRIAPLAVSDKQAMTWDPYVQYSPSNEVIQSNTLDMEASPYSNELESFDWVDSGEDEDEYEVSVVKKFTDSSSRAGVVTTVREVKKRIIKNGQVSEYIDSRDEESDETIDEGSTTSTGALEVQSGELQEEQKHPNEEEQPLNKEEEEKVESQKSSSLENGYYETPPPEGVPSDVSTDALDALEEEIKEHDFISSDLFFQIICRDDNTDTKEQNVDGSSFQHISPLTQINYNECGLDHSDYNTADKMAVSDFLDDGDDVNDINTKEDCGIVDFNILNLYLDYGADNFKKPFKADSVQRITIKDVNENQNQKEWTVKNYISKGNKHDDGTIKKHEHTLNDEHTNFETNVIPLKHKLSVMPKTKNSTTQTKESNEEEVKEQENIENLDKLMDKDPDTVAIPNNSESGNNGYTYKGEHAKPQLHQTSTTPNFNYKENSDEAQQEDISNSEQAKRHSVKPELADHFVTSNLFFLSNKVQDFLRTSDKDEEADRGDSSFTCRPFQGWFTRRCNGNYFEWMNDLFDIYT